MKKLYLLLVVLLLPLSSLLATGTCYYVSTSGTTGANGLSPASATSDLQKILTQLVIGDTVKICTGTYETPSTGNSFKIIDKWVQSDFTKNVVIRGGYNSTFTVWNPALYPTVIKANVMCKESIFYIYRCNLEMDGLTIQDANDMKWGGGGMLYEAWDGSFKLVMRNCIFRNNKSTIHGGAFLGANYYHNYYAAVCTFYNCLFDGNSTDGGGGATAAFGPDMRFYNCTFVNNYAKAGGGATTHDTAGSGFYISCTVVGNKSQAACGGIEAKTEGYIFNSIVAGNKCLNTPDLNYTDVSWRGIDWGYNIFGANGFNTIATALKINEKSIFVETKELFNLLDADGVYNNDRYFTARLANNGGFSPTIKLKTTKVTEFSTNDIEFIDNHPYTPIDYVLGVRRPSFVTDATFQNYDQRGLKRATGNTCVGAYEYRDEELIKPAFAATWATERGAVAIDFDFYKYKKDERFLHDMNHYGGKIQYSLDNITFTDVFSYGAGLQTDKRNLNERSYQFLGYNGFRFEVRNRTSAADGWKIVDNSTTTDLNDYSTSETYTGRVFWQIPTELVGRIVYLRYVNMGEIRYQEELNSVPGVVGYLKVAPANSEVQNTQLTLSLPNIELVSEWQNDGTLNLGVTLPPTLATDATYMLRLNDAVIKFESFSTTMHKFAFSAAELSKVKEFEVRSSYSPNPAFSGFPTFFVISNTALVKAYAIPENLNVSINGCEGKNTISFKVPAQTESGKYETSNFEICRDVDAQFSNYKVLGTITYDPSKTDYVFADPDNLGINSVATYYYKLRRIPPVNEWDWQANVSVGEVNYNSTHKKIKDITATIESGKPLLTWNYNTEGVFCAGSSKITIYRAEGAQAAVKVAEITDDKVTSYMDETSLSTCTPYIYSIEIGSPEHGNSSVTAKNNVMIPLSAAEQPVLQYLNASKGFYNDRVELTWYLESGTLSRFLVQRKLYEESSDNFVTIADINLTTSRLYKYQDYQSVPSMYYTYRITAVTDCNGIETESPLLSNVGFRMPTGSVGGRIVYSGDVPVENATIIIQGSEEMRNRSLELGSGTVSIPDKNNLLNPAAFSLQAWLNFSTVEGTQTIFNKNSQFQLLKNGSKLEIMVGTVTKEIPNFDIQPNTFFHLSLVLNNPTSYLVYINGNLASTITGFEAPIRSADPLIIGEGITGYMDELRIWEKALSAFEIAYNYDRYISGKETGIIAYYRLDEKVDEFIFDMSAKGITYNENHGFVTGSCPRSEMYIPTSQQLSLKGKTDTNGNYLVAGIPYFADGTSYTFTPNLGTHEFNPKQKPLFLSDRSAVQNNVDFVDVSSFKYEGYVVYDGGTYPVEGVSFTIDGRSVIDSKGALIVTDVNGKYAFKVPIGEHVIEAQKQGHTFSAGKISRNFQADVLAGFTFKDATRIKLIGRVVGGKRESDKPLLFSKAVNNIGEATIVLEPLKKDKFTMRSVSNITENVVHPYSQAANNYTIAGKTITIKTSAATGEFIAYVYPEDYKVLQVNTQSVNVLSGTSGIYLKNSTNDVYETYEYKDSIFVPASGNQLAYYKKVQKKDSVMYQAKFVQTYFVDPDFSISEIDQSKKLKNYNGDLFIEYTKQENTDAKERIDLVTFENNLPVYALNKPVYTQGNTYGFSIQAFEKYHNADNGKVDLVPVSDGQVLIDNTMKLENPNVPEIVSIDSTGYATYVFLAGAPDLSTGIKKFDAYLQKNGRVFMWANKIEPYLFGSKSTGSNFTTAGPDKVVAVLRDPPGTNSYSYLESGSTVSRANSVSKKQMFDFTSQLTFRYGPKITTFAGLGFGVIAETEVKADFKLGLHVQQNYSNSREDASSTTTTKRFQTSAEPLWVGADADVFIGVSTNFVYGSTDNITVIKTADINESWHTVLSDNGTYAVVKAKSMAMGQSFGTDFAYTQRDIERIFIPGWESIRNRLLLPPGTEIDRNTIKAPVYVSQVPFSSANFGSRNTDKKIWGESASSSPLEGPSYKIILPAGQTYLNGLDSVMWCNNQINTWKATLAANEEYKLKAKLIANQSFTSGANYEYSTSASSSSTTTSQVDYMVSALAGFETGWGFNGLGLILSVDAEIGGGADYSSTDGTEGTRTIGFVMQETGDFDALTVDYKSTADGGISFNTRAGQTSCPYEGATYTKYYQAGTLLSDATMKMEVPKISVVNSVAANVPANRNAVFTLELKNESELNADGWYRLLIDGTTNPNGAILKIDGAVVTEDGLTFLVRAGTVLRKTLTLTKGPNELEYKNIRLILASTCQYDPTGFTDDIFDDVSISASFIPNCSDINLSAPLNNWVMNTTTGDSIMVKLDGYDVNYANFGYIALQSKTASASVWNEEMKFFAKESLFNDASGAKTLLDLTKNNIQYNMPLTFPDNTYDIRAVAYCIDPTSKAVLAETPTLIASGIKDMVRPVLFGLTQPADGILNVGDEIQIQFNEDISEGIITHNNFTVTGIKNGAKTIHTSAVHFDGIANKMVTEQTMNLLAKSFTFEIWMKRNSLGAGTIISHGSTSGFEFGFTAQNKLYVKNASKIIESESTYTDISTWNHYAVVYDLGMQKISVYVNGEFAISDQVFGLYYETGMLRLGASAANTKFIAADMHELRTWSLALDRGTISANRWNTFTGIEKGMTGYWQMNEGRGLLAFDKARGRNANLTASWFINPGGKAINFSGTNSKLEINTQQLPISVSSDYTIEFWFKGNAQTNACLFSAGRGDGEEYNSSKNNLAVWFNASGLLSFANNGKTVQISPTNYLDNTWHHFALSVSRSSTANFYVDGVLTNQTDARALTAPLATSMYLGLRSYMDKNAFGSYKTDMPFAGLMDELRIWNSNRSENSIKKNLNTKLQGTETGLAAYYPFENYVVGEPAFTLKNQTVNAKETAIATAAIETADYAPIIIGSVPENLGFEFVSNKDKISIKLTEQNSAIERTTVTVSVKDIQDKNQNVLASPISWDMYIDRNQLKWEDSELVLNKAVNTDFEFTATIINSSALTQKFEITGMPSWMQVEPAFGTLKPLSSAEITISVEKGLNIGSYDEMLYLKAEYNEPLALRLNVLSEIPDWTADAGKYTGSMNIVASLFVDDLISTDKNDKLAVFINGECTGVAQPAFFPELNKHLVFLKVFGNETMQNSKLTFKVFDASSGKILSGKPATPIYFSNNSLQGMPSVPIEIKAKDEVYQIIPLNLGWTWVSFNVASTDFSTVQNALYGMVAKSGDVIKNEELGYFDAYSEFSRKWIGTLTANGGLNNTSMYLLKSSVAQKLSAAGSVIDPSSKMIAVKGAKWNYISYLPSRNISVKEALAGYPASMGDVLKSQDAFAVYDQTIGWIGDLKYMEPGKGYMLYRAMNQNTQFVYPNNLGTKSMELNTNNFRVEPGKYAETMNLIATVESDYGFTESDWILGYSGNELVSATQLNDYDKQNNARLFASIAAPTGSEIRFVLERNGEIIANASELVRFKANTLAGSLKSPITISFNAVSDKITIHCFPNPVENELKISISMKNNEPVEISITDLLGKTVVNPYILQVTDYKLETTLQSAGLQSGIYLLKVKVRNETYVQKITKL